MAEHRTKRRSHVLALSALVIVVLAVALFLQGPSVAPQPQTPPPPAAASCSASGVQPNPTGTTTVNVDSVWCGTSQSGTWLHAGGSVIVGSAVGPVSLTISNVSVQIDGNVTVGNAAALYSPVSFIVDNATIAFTRPAARILVDFVDASQATGDTIIIKSGGTLSSTGACSGCSLIRGNISNSDNYPGGIHLLSGTGSNQLTKVQIFRTEFLNNGNYWTRAEAALDTVISGIAESATYSVFAPGSFFKYLNFTGPTGMSTSDNPFAVQIGDSLPIQHAYWWGGMMGTGFTSNIWDATFRGAGCWAAYDPTPPFLIQNITSDIGEGAGCKDITFFRSDGRITNATLLNGAGINAANLNVHNITVEKVTAYQTAYGCTASNDYDITFTRNTFYNQNSLGSLNINCRLVKATNNLFYVAGNAWPAIDVRDINYYGYPFDYATLNNNTAVGCEVTAEQYGQSPYGCFQVHGHDYTTGYGNVVYGLGGISQNSGMSAGYGTGYNLTMSYIANFTYGFNIHSFSSVTLARTVFSKIGTAEYYFSGPASTAVTILNQAIDVGNARVLSDNAQPITWKWTNLVAGATYKVTRTQGATSSDFTFNTIGSGTGQVTITNPTGTPSSYTLSRVLGSAPNVVTTSVTSVASTSGTLNGDLVALGTAGSVTEGFLYGTDPDLRGATNVTVATTTSPAAFSKFVSGLTPDTTYYFAAWANGAGFGRGSILSFATSVPSSGSTPPGVNSEAAASVTSTTATLNGTLSSLGSASSVTVGFLYGTSPALTPVVNVTAGAMGSTGSFGQLLTGLAAGVTYYFQAWASGHGFVTGGILDVTTPSTDQVPPTVLGVTYNPEFQELDALFSQPMNQSSVEASLSISPSASYRTVWVNDSYLRIYLLSTLAVGQDYDLSIAAKARSLEGKALPTTFTFRFTVAPGSGAGAPTSGLDVLLRSWWLWILLVLAAVCVATTLMLWRSHRRTRALRKSVQSITRRIEDLWNQDPSESYATETGTRTDTTQR